MSTRVYVKLSTDQYNALTKRAAREHRSLSSIVAEAIDERIESVISVSVSLVPGDAPFKRVVRTTERAAELVKETAKLCGCADWQAVNAAVALFLAHRV